MKTFICDGAVYTLRDMLAANADDEALCEWFDVAQVGEVFPAWVECRRVS